MSPEEYIRSSSAPQPAIDAALYVLRAVAIVGAQAPVASVSDDGSVIVLSWTRAESRRATSVDILADGAVEWWLRDENGELHSRDFSRGVIATDEVLCWLPLDDNVLREEKMSDAKQKIPVDWSSVNWVGKTDAQLAAEYGVVPRSVAAARKDLGIAPVPVNRTVGKRLKGEPTESELRKEAERAARQKTAEELKARVKERQQRTGESYATARAAVLAEDVALRSQRHE